MVSFIVEVSRRAWALRGRGHGQCQDRKLKSGRAVPRTAPAHHMLGRHTCLITSKNFEIRKENQLRWAGGALHFRISKFAFSVSLPFCLAGLPKGCH